MSKLINKFGKTFDLIVRKMGIGIEQEINRGIVKENYWANVFNSSVQGSTWFKGVSLNVGRSAVNYASLYVLYRILNDFQPKCIVELGMGESTKMLQEYKQHLNPEALCISVEHDKSWIELKKSTGLSSELINILNSELEESIIDGKRTLKYKNLPDQLKQFDRKFNLIIIDGPFGSPHYSRYNIVELLENDFVANDFVIIMDDSNRPGEKETISRLKEKMKSKGIQFREGTYASDKSFFLLVSEKFKWAITF